MSAPPNQLPSSLINAFGKECFPYFAVYSPKTFCNNKHGEFLAKIDNSPHILVTREWGDGGTHEHANYLFYHPARDAFNVSRLFKTKRPEYVIKKVTSINNVINYMTKEGTNHLIAA